MSWPVGSLRAPQAPSSPPVRSPPGQDPSSRSSWDHSQQQEETEGGACRPSRAPTTYPKEAATPVPSLSLQSRGGLGSHRRKRACNPSHPPAPAPPQRPLFTEVTQGTEPPGALREPLLFRPHRRLGSAVRHRMAAVLGRCEPVTLTGVGFIAGPVPGQGRTERAAVGPRTRNVSSFPEAARLPLGPLPKTTNPSVLSEDTSPSPWQHFFLIVSHWSLGRFKAKAALAGWAVRFGAGWTLS